MKFKFFSLATLALFVSNVHAVTECNAKITNYFVGTSELNQSDAVLWISFDGGSASISSKSAAFDGILSTVITSIATDKIVKLRYLTDNTECKNHHSDWVGMWMYK